MDFAEGRITYHGLNREYLKDRIRKKLENTPEYFLEHYDGEQLINQCFDFFRDGKFSPLEKDKYLQWIRHGVDKKIIMASFVREAPLASKGNIPDYTRNYYLRLWKKYEWDFSYLMELDNQAFVSACYREILERRCDEPGFVSLCEHLEKGMPKEGILYIIGASEECSNLKKVKHLNHYKDIYDNYAKIPHGNIKEKLKKLLRLPGIVYYIKQLAYHAQIKNDFRYEELSRQLLFIQEQNSELYGKLEWLERELCTIRANKDKEK